MGLEIAMSAYRRFRSLVVLLQMKHAESRMSTVPHRFWAFFYVPKSAYGWAQMNEMAL